MNSNQKHHYIALSSMAVPDLVKTRTSSGSCAVAIRVNGMDLLALVGEESDLDNTLLYTNGHMHIMEMNDKLILNECFPKSAMLSSAFGTWSFVSIAKLTQTNVIIRV